MDFILPFLLIAAAFQFGRKVRIGSMFLFLVMASGVMFAADVVADPVAHVGALAKLATLASIGWKTLLKTFGAGVVIKFIIGFDFFGKTDELIHYVPESMRSFATTLLSLAIFAVYVSCSDAYSSAAGDTQLQADLVGVLGAGTSANTVHDTLATWFPKKA